MPARERGRTENWRLIQIVLIFLLPLTLLPTLSGARPAEETKDLPKDSRPGYVGDATCAGCHSKQFATYQHTSHHLTSQPANRRTVLGSFAPGANTLTIADPNTSGGPGLLFKMGARPDGLYETALTGWPPHLESQSARMDIATGSGKRGQTYLSWDGDQLFELPVSYWTDGNRWINSPGYEDGTANFRRPVNPGCLECHATYIKALSKDPTTNEYDRSTLATGTSCEVCHGPGAEHVASHTTQHATGQEILNPAKFSRDRQIDLCALCHNGIDRDALQPAFSYSPGKPLSDFFKARPADLVAHPDVHGNQVGLLERSKCFRSSGMTCTTCHDVHAPERPAAAYSQKCLECHTWRSCGISKQLGPKIAQNCIDCHMPVEPTTVIVSTTAGKTVRATMRNHWIKVYSGSGK